MTDNTPLKIKAIINTIIRLLPIGFYFGSLIVTLLFYDVRGLVLFIGLLINEFISLGFRYMFQTEDLVNCALVRSPTSFFTMPSPHTQMVAFVMSFFITDMYEQNYFDMVNFIILGGLTFVTMWSRMNIGCKNVIDIIYAFLIGSLIGSIYYMTVKDWYHQMGGESSDDIQSDIPELDVYQPE